MRCWPCWGGADGADSCVLVRQPLPSPWAGRNPARPARPLQQGCAPPMNGAQGPSPIRVVHRPLPPRRAGRSAAPPARPLLQGYLLPMNGAQAPGAGRRVGGGAGRGGFAAGLAPWSGPDRPAEGPCGSGRRPVGRSPQGGMAGGPAHGPGQPAPRRQSPVCGQRGSLPAARAQDAVVGLGRLIRPLPAARAGAGPSAAPLAWRPGGKGDRPGQNGSRSRPR